MVILAFVNSYLPGYKAGGPLQSVANLTERLGESFQFKIVTADRDYGDSKPYPSVRPGEWQRVGRAQVLYLPPKDHSPWNLRRVMNGTQYDLLYLNSLFSPTFTLLPLLLWQTGLTRDMACVIAPRGELSPGALGIKNVRKRLFLRTAQALNVYKDVLWQASGFGEQADIRRWFRGDATGQNPVVVAPDLPFRGDLQENATKRRAKQRGRLRLLFASRISPKKNLIGALRCLQGLRGVVDFDICGPVDDVGYWLTCRKFIADLPANIVVNYQGPIPHDQVVQEMAQHDLFFLPTLGENFGHAIVEALWAGCPVLISDQTPWRDLESAGAGWDLPVERDQVLSSRASALH